ncbi:MAG: cytochrome C oxidase subunit II [Gammaproteobacteria bacterium]|jgi:cytochrome c oxidase subunit 2|nr:cytochrome C oxidase subunit II [Gammaproteobacteria bacterium]MBT3721957.1 cytochrome C oxidase subunit II [Gammaproteobacteria bacterium]MBT4075856.1 cytochrome C oxidase subunit II [Gammaproteobacteria bacterium]MBT4195232.1 cytochrome C oxidase subunit II [Gammaproteobacteria bacterium]MBT4451316.1 cytochrome C oxidase subunit II [Gammaproteobacteria bacterium]
MHIDQTEKKWIWVSILMTFVMMGVLTLYAVGSNIHPPSGFEPIDSTRLHLSEEFGEDNLGLKKAEDGSLVLTMVAARYGFYPSKIEVPVDTPVKIRIASADVLHGVHVPYTNFATMVVPGYISEVNTTFVKTGDFTLLCNEYCGLGHDHMWSRLKVVPKSSS